MSLKHRRETVEHHWHRFVKNKRLRPLHNIPQAISASWQRSQTASPGKLAPLEDPYETKYRWHESSIHTSAKQELGQLIDVASEGELVTAISDPTGRLLWTHASEHMQDRAADVNFIAGGRWGEQSAGTNAVGLCLVTQKPVTVFSAEHFQSTLHEWVCYAAPIIHPQTGKLVGTLDLSSTWEKHTPLGQAAVEQMARSIAKKLPIHEPQADLELHMLGQPHVIYQGNKLPLSSRHCEILCLLALNPRGMTLNDLHAALYGDQKVTQSTLKSEISTLRTLLRGQIDSRPYRLKLSCWADFTELWSAIRSQNIERAYSLYQGSLLTHSISPEIEQWRHCIDAVMTQSLHSCDDIAQVIRQCNMSAGELVRERLIELASH